jgi:predicted metal-dependent phosphoesterase TrpH
MLKMKSIAAFSALIMLFVSVFCTSATSDRVTYNVYYGSLHNHTDISDGAGTPCQAYAYAKNTAGLDFFGLADHAESITSTEWTTAKNAADSYNQDGTFVTFYGFEWSHSTYGHVAVINTTDYCKSSSSTTNTFGKLVTWLSARNGVAFLNHPGRQDSTGVEFNHFTTAPSSKFVGMELWNKNDAFNTYYYNDGYYTNDGNKGYFDEANSRGWKVGAAGANDNHTGTWGMENSYRLAVLATSKTRASIYDALQNRRFFTTLDKNLTLSFELNEAQMGSTISAGSHNAVIKAGDGNSELFNEVKLFKNGTGIYTWNPNTTSPIITQSITTSSGDYYYVKVKQADGNEAISSPIYIQ